MAVYFDERDDESVPWRGQPVRRAKQVASGSSPVANPTGGFWTIAEYDAATGQILQTFDRGVTYNREVAADLALLYSSDGFLYAAGASGLGGDNYSGFLIKYDVDSGDLVWRSDEGSLHPAVPRNAVGNIVNQVLTEADDGGIWVCRAGAHTDDVTATYPVPYVARYDPDTGAQTHEYGGVNRLGWAVYPAASGAICVSSPNISEIRRLSSSAALTHTLSATSQTDVVDDGSNLIVVSGRQLKIVSKADLSVTTFTPLGVGVAFVAVETDGTTIWTATGEPKYRAYDYSGTEQWNNTRAAAANTVRRLRYDGTDLYDFSQRVYKIDAASGATTWSSLPSAGFGIADNPGATAFGSDFLITATALASTSAGAVFGSAEAAVSGIICLEKSTGDVRWFDNIGTKCVVVTDTDRIFACHTRRGA